MPIYEFNCCKCRKKFELLIRSSDKCKPVCVHCNSKKLERLLSGFAIGGGNSGGSSSSKSCSGCSSSSCSSCR
ncbi:MAG: zinc ribbon domain-containing protein [Planctomycetes bacterium]|nr:zinc ribbon domain-containing protein [Planctomycetota bacterium]